MILTLDGGAGTLATINLDENAGDLRATGGNLYLNIDGVEWGSVWFDTEAGTLRIMLGQFDLDEQWWAERNPLTHPTQYNDPTPEGTQ